MRKHSVQNKKTAEFFKNPFRTRVWCRFKKKINTEPGKGHGARAAAVAQVRKKRIPRLRKSLQYDILLERLVAYLGLRGKR